MSAASRSEGGSLHAKRRVRSRLGADHPRMATMGLRGIQNSHGINTALPLSSCGELFMKRENLSILKIPAILAIRQIVFVRVFRPSPQDKWWNH